MTLLAIDPGTTHSGVVRYSPISRAVLFADAAMENSLVSGMLRANLRQDVPDFVVTERIAAMGMAVGAETFTTCEWIGYLSGAAGMLPSELPSLTRVQVKLTLCGSVKAKDPNIRQRLLDLHGGNAAADPARKCKVCKGRGLEVVKRAIVGKCQECENGWTTAGPLAGVTSHSWSALAVAVAWAMRQGENYDL